MVTRASWGQEKMPKISATLVMEGTMTAAIMIIRGSMGRVMKMSMKASTTSLTIPLV